MGDAARGPKHTATPHPAAAAPPTAEPLPALAAWLAFLTALLQRPGQEHQRAAVVWAEAVAHLY